MDPHTYGDRGKAARCFNPGMGFSFDVINVLVCLHCRWVIFYRKGESVDVVPSDEGLKSLIAVYERFFGAA